MAAVGLPCGSMLLNIAVDPVGMLGLRLRIEFGTSHGTCGTIGRRATIVSSSGLIRTVSFQPSSPGSVGMMMLSQVTRFRTWTSYRWKWIGWVSTPLCVIFQIWVPSLPSLMAWTLRSPFGRLVPSMTSVGGATYG